MIQIEKITRRDFVKTGASVTSAGLVLGYASGFSFPANAEGPKKGGFVQDYFRPNVFISIDSDNKVRLVCHRTEIGQGVRTSMLMLLAEELEVDLKDVIIVQGKGDARFGDQNTDGSTSARLNYEPLRIAGASAREMLVTAAAQTWSVKEETCKAESGKILHDSGKSLTYGQLAKKASTLPVPKKPKLKSAKEFKIVGKPLSGLDVPAMTQGKAMYGIDTELPGMMYASLERSPTVGGKVKSFDAKAALKIAGVKKVVKLDPLPQMINTNAAIAVIATNTWAANEGRKVLKATWDLGKNAKESSDGYRKIMEEALNKPGRAVRTEGDYGKAKSATKNNFSATYHTPYLAHATMEPLAATALVKRGSCEVWAPTQDPQRAQKAIAGFLKIKAENVTVNVTLAGGGFGRKSQPDFVLEAVALSQKLAQPVKVTWTREDEIQHGFYHAECLQQLTANWDKSGNIDGWHHKTIFPTILTVFDPKANTPADFEVGMGCTDMPYRIPNVLVETGQLTSPVRIGWLRSVCNVFHAFGVNSFMDEVAAEQKIDPVEFRLKMLGEGRKLPYTWPGPDATFKQDTARLARVISKTKEMSKWGKSRGSDRGLGFANHYSFYSYVAMAIEASINKDGQAVVHKVDCAVDCGQVINPDSVRAQVEGAIIFGLSAALYGRITLKNGQVEQSNFHDYNLLRHPQTPEMNIHLFASEDLPTGIGEPGVPPVAPALCAALFELTGKRIRELPISLTKLAKA